MGRGVDMDTDTTDEALAALQKLADATSTTWTHLHAEMVNKEEGIGQGKLAQAFRPTYVPVAEPTRTVADDLLGKLTVTLHSGRVSVQTYRDADAAAAGAFPRPR